MLKTTLVKSLFFVASLLLLTGCNVDVSTNIAEGTSLAENDPKVIFKVDDWRLKKIFKLKERVLTVNDIDRTEDTVVRNKKMKRHRPLKVVYQPVFPRLLPEGNVTIKLTIPYRNSYWACRYFGVTSLTKELHLFIDTISPTIAASSPDENSTIHNELTSLSYTVEDAGSKIDPSSVSVTINGEDATALSTLTDNNLTISPTADFMLPEGNITVSITIADRLGNSATKEFHYIGSYDEIPPSAVMLSPAAGSIVTDPLTRLIFDIHDDENGSGLDESSVQIIFSENNTSYPLILDANTSHYSYTPTTDTPLPYGNLLFTVHAKDRSGNEVNEALSLFIQEKDVLSAIPVATPSSAYAPATIRFSPQVTTDNAIQTYSWDFNGDGSYDRSDITANSYTWQYTTPGDYNVTLKVVDANNEVIIGSTIVHILNAAPQITVESSPSNGEIPLTVSFSVTATDSDGIALYEWDFDGDGVYDYNSTDTGNTSYTYTTQGVFNAQLRVTDSRGATAIYTTPTTKVIASAEGSPSVTAEGTPLTGSAPLNVSFSATAVDPQDKGFVLYEWDFDGDGTYDYNSSTTASTSFTFEEAGTFYPKLKVTTTDGRVTYDALEVIAGQSVSLSVSTDTIDVLQGAQSTIHTTLAARAQIKIIVEDENYNPVKIVQDWAVRDGGAYDDVWDGTDATGATVKEGKYYAVLLYKIGEEIKRLDLRDTTGGSRYNPSRNEAPRSFAPFDNRPLKMTFTLPRASEVVSFMGYSNSNTRIITFRSREPLGRGSYTDIWNSQNDEGVLISPPPGKYFMYGVWAFSLADNAIYVKSGAHISGLLATPPIFTPDSHEANGKPATLKIHFALNKAATVEFELFDATSGVPVATRSYTGLSAGEQVVEFDGKDNNGVYLHPGTYTLGIRAVDENGYRSIMEYTVTRIYY